MSDEIKEWVKVATSGDKTFATVSLVQGTFSAKYVAKCYESSVKEGVRTARKGARRQLVAIQEAIAELDAEEETDG